jgi:hypothetical protein
VTITEYVELFDDFGDWDGPKQVEYFAYFLTGVMGQRTFSAKEIKECFEVVYLKPYSRIAPFLSEHAHKGKGGRFVKLEGEYRLERSAFEDIRRKVEEEPKKIAVSQQLTDLLLQVTDLQEHAFLKEAIDCYRVRAFRATIVLVWILVVHHLYRFVFDKKLAEFNSALAKNPDKKLKIVVNLEDISEISESKFLELLRAASLISNDQRKILEEKLGVRNSAAHPSEISFDGHKATEFSSDLLRNILLKIH